MGAKVQYMGLVEDETMHGLDSLRIVTGESRARVSEKLIVRALKSTRREYADQLARLDGLAARAGVSVQEYVKAYARAHARSTYGATLNDLEEDDSAVRAMLAWFAETAKPLQQQASQR
jgi:hypothetical protein